MRWRCWLALIVGVLCFVTPHLAFAHPEIVKTEPEADASLAAAPPWIRITFNEPLEASFSDVHVFDAQGQRVDEGGGGRAQDDPNALFLPLPPLTPGLYTVVWQTVGSDGHQVIGNFAFTILGPTSTPGPTINEITTPIVSPTTSSFPPVTPSTPAGGVPASTSDLPAVLIALFRAIMVLGAAMLVGGWTLIGIVLRPILTAGPDHAWATVRHDWRRGMWWGSILLLIGIIGFVLLQTLTLTRQMSVANIYALLFTTRLGQSVLARLILLAALAAVGATIRELQKWRIVLALLLGGGLLLTFSLSSHAAVQATLGVPILADWLHFAAASTWLGGLMILAVTLPSLLSSLPSQRHGSALAQVITRFSGLALGSVILLSASGIYTALLHLPALSDLWTSSYGQTLLLKIGFFGALIGLGAYNMLIVRPAVAVWADTLGEIAAVQRWTYRFLGAVRSEVVLAILTIGVVGFLTNTAPPKGQRPRLPIPTVTQPTVGIQPTESATQPPLSPTPSKPFTETQTIADLQISLEVTPARLGQNRFLVTVRDTTGKPVDAQKVLLTIEMLDMDMGQNTLDLSAVAPGHYEAARGWLTMVGDWQFTVVVRRADADDVTTSFRMSLRAELNG